MKTRDLVYGLLALALVYCAVAFAVFEWRHPWTTDTERLVWSWSALKFESVPYSEMRPRGGQ